MSKSKSFRILILRLMILSIGLLSSCTETPFVTTNPDCQSGWIELPASVMSSFIRDAEYQEGRIFDPGPDTLFGPGDFVKKLIIYESQSDELNPQGLLCQLHIDPRDTSYKSDVREEINMVPVDPELFVIYKEYDRYRRRILFDVPRLSSSALGIFMIIARSYGVEDTIGDLSGEEPILMTLRSSPAKADPDHEPWWYMWRNVYRIPKHTQLVRLGMTIRKGVPGSETDPANLDFQSVEGEDQGSYVEILGLDQYDAYGDDVPDGLVDDRLDVYRADLGLLIFPHGLPFDSDTTFNIDGSQTAPLAERVPGIYTSNSPTEKMLASAYYISLGIATKSAVITLPCDNLQPGSEQLRFNGGMQIRDVDYQIDYEMGVLTLVADELLDPDGLLEIRLRLK